MTATEIYKCSKQHFELKLLTFHGLELK